ncbi:MAG: tRNA (adenosine(37)-N6)-dimethylallyltransferase MiaA [Candidatus Omnitrophota bacterium]
MKKMVVFLVGPTAVGKSEIGVCLSKKLNAEIISCDSMQIYKKMSILTSKPSAVLTSRIPHHLADLVPPSEEYSVSRYYEQAVKKITGITNRGKTPLFVGGTGLYMSILIDGLFKMEPPDKVIREKLYQQAEEEGSLYLYNRLNEVDPQAADKIHPNDTRRIVRALEVYEATGKPISLLQKQRSGIADKYDVRIFCLDMQRDKLYQRIEQRVDEMFAKGLIKEVKALLKLKLSKTARCAIGIRELQGYFNGEYDLDEARKQMVHNTCLYAKRQLTWFRKDKRITWININDNDSVLDITQRVLSCL